MSMEERGIYITLLSHCWLEGWLPNGSTKLQRICNYPSNWKKSWSNIKHCFYENGGKLYHKRLEEERKKQLEWKKKSRLGGIKSGESRRQLKGGSRVVEPKGNSSSSSSSSSSKRKPIKPKSSYPRIKILECDIELTKLLLDKILENNPESRVRKMTNKQKERWQNDCRLMREQDGRAIDDIREVITWAQDDDFWHTNILSMGKLRKQWDQLILKMGKTAKKKESWAERSERKEREREGNNDKP